MSSVLLTATRGRGTTRTQDAQGTPSQSQQAASEQRGNTVKFEGRVPESQGQNLALTVLYVPYSPNSGPSNWSIAATVFNHLLRT